MAFFFKLCNDTNNTQLINTTISQNGVYKKMAKITAISGFPEYLPAEQKVFSQMMDTIRHHYELYGFSQIETPAVERIDTLSAKGGNEKEIYALRRLAAQEGEKDEKDLALHFDLTVPLARYVAQHYGQLSYPFKRYQMQPVWRGERPQAGRYRQFYQCDIDVIGNESLPVYYDAEIIALIYKTIKALNIGDFVIRLNNRKALQGMLSAFDIPEDKIAQAIKVIDDIEKVPAETTAERLTNLGSSQAEELLTWFNLDTDNFGRLKAYKDLDGNDMLEEGVSELTTVYEALLALDVPESAFKIDPAIARGLDYYTGTVYETNLVEHKDLGSISSGGRYQDLIGKFSNKNCPGVGGSIGLTRLFPELVKRGIISIDVPVGADVFVTAMDDSQMPHYIKIAEKLRNAGIKTEVLMEKKKFDKQMKLADKKGCKLALIMGEDEINSQQVTIKNLTDGQQQSTTEADLISTVKSLLK